MLRTNMCQYAYVSTIWIYSLWRDIIRRVSSWVCLFAYTCSASIYMSCLPSNIIVISTARVVFLRPRWYRKSNLLAISLHYHSIHDYDIAIPSFEFGREPNNTYIEFKLRRKVLQWNRPPISRPSGYWNYLGPHLLTRIHNNSKIAKYLNAL